MRTVTVHKFTTRLGDYAFRTRDEADAFAASCRLGVGCIYPVSPITEMTVPLPIGALWHGDVIAAEVLRGQQFEEDNGFDSGGTWVPIVGYIVPTRGVTFDEHGAVSGIAADIIELGTEAVVGVLNAAAPDRAAAVRNIKIVRCRDAHAGSL